MITDESLQERTLRLLEKVPNEFDKRDTSILYQSVAMIIPELIRIESDIAYIESESFPDTCGFTNLVRFCEGRITPKFAKRGVVVAEFDKEIDMDLTFSLNGEYYTVFEKVSEEAPETEENLGKYPYPELEGNEEYYRYRLLAEEVGHIYEVGDIIPIRDVRGLKLAKIIYVEKDGREDEDVEELRARYMQSLSYQAFGGNRASYIEFAEKIENVGGIKVFRRENGKDYIDIYLIGYDGRAVSDEILKSAQETIDPTFDGGGFGLAPIGHKVMCHKAEEEELTISINITKEGDLDLSEDIKKAINEYLTDLSRDWGLDDKSLIVRISHIENKVLSIRGIIDIEDTTINGIAKNHHVKPNAVPIVKEVIINDI